MEINWYRLQQARDFLATQVQPEQFDMDHFYWEEVENHGHSSQELLEAHDSMPCGTVGCVLGHCALNPKLNPERLSPYPYSEQVLGITLSTRVWDYLFSDEWARVCKPAVQLEQAIYRLDQLLHCQSLEDEVIHNLCQQAFDAGQHSLNS